MRRMLLRTEEIYKSMKAAEADRNNLERQARELRRDAENLSEQIIAIQNERTKLQQDVDSYKNEVASLKEEISTRETQLDILANSLAGLESKLAESGKKLADANSELERTRSEKLSVESEIVSLKKNLENLENDITSKVKQIDTLNVEINSKNDEIKRMETSELAFHEGQRLYGFTIKNSLSKKEILDAVEKSFQDFKNQGERNLNCTLTPDPRSLYNALEEIDNSKSDESIILVFSKKNSFRGDEIPVEFMVLDQYLVFKEGRVIAEERLEKKLNILEAREMVGGLIQKAENQALDLGLLRDPYRRISKFPAESLNREADQIENHRRPMIVRLVAKSDIYRSDYLDESNMKFEIVDG